MFAAPAVGPTPNPSTGVTSTTACIQQTHSAHSRCFAGNAYSVLAAMMRTSNCVRNNYQHSPISVMCSAREMNHLCRTSRSSWNCTTFTTKSWSGCKDSSSTHTFAHVFASVSLTFGKVMDNGAAASGWVLTKHSFRSIVCQALCTRGCRSNESQDVVFVCP